MGADRSTAVVAPEIVFRRLAVASAAGFALIALTARDRSPLVATLAVLGAMTLLSLLLARMPDDTRPRAVAIVVLAALTAQLGYFFGPNSAYAAPLAITLAVTGLLSARQPGRRSQIGWLVMIVICAGQLAIVVLVSYGVLADRSLSPILRHGQEPWQNIAAHLVSTAVFVCAFLAGRAAQKRYRQIVFDAVDASRKIAIREALLDEARAEYERALALQAARDEPTIEPVTDAVTNPRRPSVPEKTEPMTAPPPPKPAAPPRPRASMTVIDDGSQRGWAQALQFKLRMQDMFVLGACLVGVYFSASIIQAPTPRLVSLVAIILIVVMVATRAVLLYSRPNVVITWPYPVIAFLSAGPAYGFGLHAAFAAIVATILFTGRLFRSPVHYQTRTNLAAVWAVCVGHGAMFVLVLTGVLPDASNLPVRLPGHAWYAPYLHHAMVQGIYIIAYVVGGRIDREFVRAADIAREAYAEAVRADTRLQIARTELDAALKTEGLFTGTEVGSYRLGRLLGRGGMGEVYRAERAGQRVALKLLRADRLGDPAALERFAHEARLLTRITSPYCARVIEVSDDREVPFMAMEYVDGPSLSVLLRERGRLDPTEVVALVDDLARGVNDVHAAGVVHLDLKPANVLRGDGRWKIVDFGVARMVGEAHRRVAGTPPYMAPEQALGEPIDTRTDLYSLSLILYRAITGMPAYTGPDAVVIANRARTVGPPDPRELVTIEEDLALVLRIGLAARVADRFTTADELRTAFIGALGGRLDPRIRARGRDLLARAPWAPGGVALLSGPRSFDVSSLRSTR